MTLDIVAIKNAFKAVLDAANTSTAAYDLSTSLTADVKTISTKSPNSYMFGADMLPAVAIWNDRKKVDMAGIVKDQITAKRKATITLNIAGVIWNNNYTSVNTDSSDNEIEKLMENIEEVIRRNPSINGTVLWQHPTDVTYHDLTLSEEQNYKVGIMTVECAQLY